MLRFSGLICNNCHDAIILHRAVTLEPKEKSLRYLMKDLLFGTDFGVMRINISKEMWENPLLKIEKRREKLERKRERYKKKWKKYILNLLSISKPQPHF